MEAYTEGKIKELQDQLKSLRQERNNNLDLKRDGDRPEVQLGVRRNGKLYTVRDNRDRFFFPKEWEDFFDNLKPSQRMTFDFLVNTGARINEAINVKVGDISPRENRIILRVTKVKARKGERAPRPRTIAVSSQFMRRLNKYLRDEGIFNKNDEKLGLLSKPAAHIAMKKALKAAKIKDWYMFSLHNIRKTHGNWLKAKRVDAGEICTRLGHDYNTYLSSYGSANIFTPEEIKHIKNIMGDIYEY